MTLLEGEEIGRLPLTDLDVHHFVMTSLNRNQFLASCDVIDWQCAAVREMAAQLTAETDGLDTIAVLFNWVRDCIPHTADVGRGKLTLRASDVLRERTGLCYAKSHLLAALLRAVNVPAGLCYQRLRCDDTESSFVLHGLVGVLMPNERFMRIDPRGNKSSIGARFMPTREALAFSTTLPGEADLPGVFARPNPVVVSALSGGENWHPLKTRLPDILPEQWPTADAEWSLPMG